jgi:ribosome maturation factor RimP
MMVERTARRTSSPLAIKGSSEPFFIHGEAGSVALHGRATPTSSLIGQGARRAPFCFLDPDPMTDKASEISALLAPTVTSLGLELLGADYLPSPGGAVLRLYIDVPLAEQPERVVNIDDCERVSREVSAQLDVEDPITANYTLEVSSPGVDRPLFTFEQFERAVGESAKVTLSVPQDGRRRLQGEILGVDAEKKTVTFKVDNSPFTAELENIEKARIMPDWAALGLAPTKPTGPAPKQGGKANKKP